MSSLIELFQKASSPSSNEEIAAVTQALMSQYPYQEFYQTCIQIILSENNQISMNIKMQALINFKNGILTCWKEKFDQNMKSYLLSQIPNLLANSPTNLIRVCEKLSDKIIEISLFHDNISFLIDILPQLFQQNARAGLIISKSIFKYIKFPKDEMIPKIIHFASLVLPLIGNLCQQCNDLVLLNFAYHCLSRFFYIKRKDITNLKEQIIQNYGLIYYQKFMSLAAAVPNPINGEYIKFLIEGIKFLSQISKKLNNEQVVNIFSFIQMIFQLPNDKNMKILKSKTIYLLNSLIINDERYTVFEANMQLIIQIVFSQLLITDQDIDEMANDPVTFTQENPQVNSNWDDVKASCCNFISNYIKIKKLDTSALIKAIYQIASTSLLQSNSRYQIFTSFRLLTTAVSKKCAEYFNQFVPYLCQAADHQDFVVRAGSFLVLSNVSKNHIPPQVINVCINHLNDPAPIVCYYAALALAQSFYLSKKQIEYEQYKAMYSPQINAIYTSLINISTRFNDSYVSEALSLFVVYFNEQILPLAVPLFDKITETFINSCISGESELSEIEETSSKALHILIKLISKIQNMNFENSIAFYGHFYERLISAIQATASSSSVTLLFPLLQSLINLSPGFNPAFWDLLNPLLTIVGSHSELDLDEVIPVIEQLIFRDTDLASKGQNMAALCKLLFTADTLISSPTFCASLIMRCGPALPCINEIVAGIRNAAAAFGDKNLAGESICNTVSAIFLKFDNYSSLFEGGDMSLLKIWVSHHSFPFYVASFLKIFNNFSNDPNMQAQMLKSCFDSILERNDEDDDNFGLDDDDDDDMGMNDLADDDNEQIIGDIQAKPGEIDLAASENPQWFEEKLLAQQAFQLAKGLIDANSPVVQVFGLNEFGQKMNMLAAYLNNNKSQ